MSLGEFLEYEYKDAPPSIFTEVFQLLIRQPKPNNLTPHQQSCWLFWESIDLAKIESQKISINTYQFIELKKTGVSILNDKGSTYNYAPLHIYYFRSGIPSIVPMQTRIELLDAIEAAFHKDKDTLKKDRCVLINYDKIDGRNWQVTTSADREEGLYLWVQSKGISAGSFYGTGASGSDDPLETFWYDRGSTTVSNEWPEKVPEILGIISVAIVADYTYETQVKQLPGA